MKVILNDNKIAFTSDLHINHRKLCTGYENHFDRTRKYVTVEEMNEDIVRRWNDTVDDETTVFFLGDFTLGTPAGKLVQGILCQAEIQAHVLADGQPRLRDIQAACRT